MDSTDLVALIKKAATEAVDAGKPANILFGKVISPSPIQVQLDQQIILGAAQLTVARLLQGYTVTVEDVPLVVVPPLAAGERVILAQVSGGQHYVVLDRVGD
jgi:hypothetical protein